MIYSKLIIIALNFFDFFQQKKILKLVNSKFSKPIVVFDIGAHYGETIKLFTKKLRIEKIFSFEASPKNYRILEKKISNYDSNKVKIFNYGIGEKISDGFINQTLESSSSTINEINLKSKYLKRKLKILNIDKKDSIQSKVPIKILSLDYFIERNNIKNIDLLKIDTEGYEFNVLKGMSKYNHLVKLIYFEHHYDDMIKKNYKFKDINQLLIKYGFKKIYKSKMYFRKSFEYIYENTII